MRCQINVAADDHGYTGPDWHHVDPGDQAAFAQLYDCLSSAVWTLTMRVLRDPRQAEEVAYDAFIDVWNAGLFDPHGQCTPKGITIEDGSTAQSPSSLPVFPYLDRPISGYDSIPPSASGLPQGR